MSLLYARCFLLFGLLVQQSVCHTCFSHAIVSGDHDDVKRERRKGSLRLCWYGPFTPIPFGNASRMMTSCTVLLVDKRNGPSPIEVSLQRILLPALIVAIQRP